MRSAGEKPAGGADLRRVIRRLDQENEAVDLVACERGSALGVGAEPGGGEAREDTQTEARGVSARCRVRVTRDPRQIGKLRMARLGIEAVAVGARDRRHARTEAPDHNGRRRVGAKIARGPVEAIVRAREARGIARPEAAQDLGGLGHTLRAYPVALDGEAERFLLSRIGRLLAATRAEAEDEAPARDLLESRRHAGEKTWVPAGHVQ